MGAPAGAVGSLSVQVVLLVVRAQPVASHPTNVVIKLHYNFLEVFARGANGERAFFRLPM